MVDRELISIVMGVHNTNKISCDKAISSLINQTYSNWELIICNDGSSDDTFNFLRSQANRDKRIKVISTNENKGLANALNKCILESKGNYIARMDDDDISDPRRLEIEYSFLKQNKQFDFVSCNYYLTDGVDKKVIQRKKIPRISDFLWTSPFLHPATMFRRSCLEKVNGYRVSKETARAEDYDLYMRLYTVGSFGYNIQKPLYTYYVSRFGDKNKSNFKYRIYESKVRKRGFKELKIPFFISLFFVLKPLIVGIIPLEVLNHIKLKSK